MFTSRDKDEWEAKDDKNGSQFANPSADSQYYWYDLGSILPSKKITTNKGT